MNDTVCPVLVKSTFIPELNWDKNNLPLKGEEGSVTTYIVHHCLHMKFRIRVGMIDVNKV